jgi:hypothetical protein
VRQSLCTAAVTGGVEYGNQKPFQMARSILPSTDRSVCRHRAALHRASRRAVRVQLSRFVGDVEAWEDEAEIWDDPQHEISRMVRDRRGADKLNHFQRWAARVTDGLSAPERLGKMRALLPAGLIGDHAMSHLKRVPEFMTEHEKLLRQRWRRRAPSNWIDRGELAELLREVLEAPEGHKLFNHALKKSRGEEARNVRTLLGLHDVRAFLRDIARTPLFHVVQWFCGVWKKARDSRAAWLALFPGERLPE